MIEIYLNVEIMSLFESMDDKTMKIRMCIILILLIFIPISCAPSFGASDVGNSKNYEHFRFEDYASFEKFRAAVSQRFPIGTNKKDIDIVMVKENGAEYFEDSEDKSGYNRIRRGEILVRYVKPHKADIECTFRVISIFTEERTLRFINGYYGCTGP